MRVSAFISHDQIISLIGALVHSPITDDPFVGGFTTDILKM